MLNKFQQIDKPGLKNWQLILMAVICGVTVANLYYIQPLEAQLAATFTVPESAIGIIVMVTQLGYALGLLLFVPLGDIAERKRIIMLMLALVSLFLVLVAIVPTYISLIIVMFAVGLTTIIPQLILPYAAQLSCPEKQGENIGIVMSGLLIGILLSRTFSGLLGDLFPWQIVYLLAGLIGVLLFILIAVFFPRVEVKAELSYLELLRSIPALIKEESLLREAALNGFFMFGSFNIFWTSLIFLLKSPVYNLGSKEAGLFGLAGAAGAGAAPLIGKLGDRKSPTFVVGIGVLLSTFAYLIFSFLGFKIWGLIIGVILLDLGNQFGQVSNQARIQLLGDQSRSRNTTIFMFSYFIGGAAASFLGTLCWQYFGWFGVCLLGLTFQIIAVIIHTYYQLKPVQLD